MIDLNRYTAIVPVFVLALARISAFVSISPVFAVLSVSPRVRVLISVVLTVMTVTTLPPASPLTLLSPLMYLLLFKEVLFGLLTGLVFLLVFEVAFVAGEILSMQGGLSMANVLDPIRGSTIPVIGNFYYLTLAAAFFSMNAHLIILHMMIKSFQVLPPWQNNFSMDSILVVVQFLQMVFANAIWAVFPAIIALLIVNVVFAIVASTSPQFSIFNIGFPIITMGALLLVYITIGGFVDHGHDFFNDGFRLFSKLLQVSPNG